MEISKLHSHFLLSKGICTDTRKLKKGELFFALKGDNFDGNKYAEQAILNGASFAVVDDKKIQNSKFIHVENTLQTLQTLANYHRRHLDISIIALTGSNGKTTTKELIHAVLSKKYKTTSTIGNLNNHIGVPLTLLSMNEETQIGVVEMGANHLKEIEFLCNITEPNFGYITNIGKAHLEGFGSEENILIGKTELFKFIKKNKGKVFCNSNDQKLMSKIENIDSILFSNHTNSDYQIKITENNSKFVAVKFNDVEINSQLVGNYNFTNIASSIAIGAHFGVPELDIKEAIENYIPQINRSQIIEKKSNNIILDAYNANPTSMKAAIENFEKIKSDYLKAAILGDMFELGSYAKMEHQKIIELVSTSDEIEKVFLVGENFYNYKNLNKEILFFRTTDLLMEYLKENTLKKMSLLIKGSRGMALERVLEFL